MTRYLRAAAAGLALTLGTAGLAACSGGSSGTSATSASASASVSASASATRGFGGNVFGSAKVQTCLKAAGITVPTGRAGGFPSGSRSRPSGSFPSRSFPSGSRPSGAGGGFGGNSAQSQKIQAALKACGITLPTGGNRARVSGATPSATPSASPTS
jgi:hypothetical protein